MGKSCDPDPTVVTFPFGPDDVPPSFLVCERAGELRTIGNKEEEDEIGSEEEDEDEGESESLRRSSRSRSDC